MGNTSPSWLSQVQQVESAVVAGALKEHDGQEVVTDRKVVGAALSAIADAMNASVRVRGVSESEGGETD